MAMGLGVCLTFAGVVTNYGISAAGLLLTIVSIAGLLHESFSGKGVEEVELEPALRPRPIHPASAEVETLRPGMPGDRMRLPEKIHPYSAGARGGIYGGIAMAATAALYGLVSDRGVWYPINLLAGMVLTRFNDAPSEQLQQFDFWALIVGLMIHAVTSVCVGLFFGIILPTLPKYPVLWAGIVAPILWTGAIYAFMGVLNPVLREHVDWRWFFASQFAYGLTMGIVVVQSEKIPVGQSAVGRSPIDADQGGRP
jgi:hypothetical protein